MERDIFSEIVNDPTNIQIDIATQPYDQINDFGLFEGEQLKRLSPEDIGFSIDPKFIHATWLDFFNEYIVPSIHDRIHYQHLVNRIDYSGNQVIVHTTHDKFIANQSCCFSPG